MKGFFSKIAAYWAGLGHVIGVVMTPVHMFIVYVLVFGPSNLILRLMGRDPLERRLVPAPSFWHKKDPPDGTIEGLRHTFCF